MSKETEKKNQNKTWETYTFIHSNIAHMETYRKTITTK